MKDTIGREIQGPVTRCVFCTPTTGGHDAWCPLAQPAPEPGDVWLGTLDAAGQLDEALADIAAGRVVTFPSMDALLADLHASDGSER